MKKGGLQSYTLRIRGPFACFTLPYGPDRTSSLIPSQDAANGILRSIYGQMEMKYNIHELTFLRKPEKITLTTNELSDLGIRASGPVAIEENRTQRSNTILKNVDYLVKASIIPSGFGNHEANLAKFNAMFHNRITKGKQWSQTYLGQREYTGQVELVEDPTALKPAPFDLDLGLHYYGFDFHTRTPYFTPLAISKGRVKYPSWAEVRANGVAGVSK